ncbi:MAG TPA: hypothetical protein VL284_18115 [Thermoanaerobaculia bacterium]|nr:hypothetical protein [Thermoanaerobaculia bacterium]
MLGVAHFLLLTALTIATNTLVLRTGERIGIDGPVKVEAGRVIFRSGGALYSVAESDVDLNATDEAGVPVAIREEKPGRLKVTAEEKARLLRDLENNHSGTAASAEALSFPAGPGPEQEMAAASGGEWSWKYAAQAHEEAIRQAQENLDLLRNKADALRSHIAGLLSLGYKPDQFSYDTTQLAHTEEQIPGAALDVQRAQRAFDQFRDDARRQGVLPGYLR